MENEVLILLSFAFTTGILGSGHCIGMCGGIVCAFFMHLKSQSNLANLVYHCSRILVYSCFGLLAAFLGETIIASGGIGLAQGVLKIVVGIIVVLLGWDFIGNSPISKYLNFISSDLINNLFNKITKFGSIKASALCGIFNAFLPCSLTLAMVFQATTVSSVFNGGLLMLFFGIGTLPSMLSVTWLFTKLSIQARKWLTRSAGIIVVIMGLFTIYQGYKYLIMFNLF